MRPSSALVLVVTSLLAAVPAHAQAPTAASRFPLAPPAPLDDSSSDTANRKMSGPIAVQVHVGGSMKVAFRNFLLKELP